MQYMCKKSLQAEQHPKVQMVYFNETLKNPQHLNGQKRLAHSLHIEIVVTDKHRIKPSSLILNTLPLFTLQQNHPCLFLIDQANCMTSFNLSSLLLYSVDHKSIYTYPKDTVHSYSLLHPFGIMLFKHSFSSLFLF